MGLKEFLSVLVLAVFVFFFSCGIVSSSPLIKESGEGLERLGSSGELIDSPDKRFDNFANGFGASKRSFDEINRSNFGFNKRMNFDEIGRSQFGFNKRRDFDEIGRSQFGFNKRRDFDEIGRSSFGFNKRGDFDEIGRSSFGFNKRGDFDEIGRSSFGFYRRSPQPPRNLSRWRFFSSLGKRRDDSSSPSAAAAGAGGELETDKRSFDEINRSSFGFNM